MSGGEAMVQEAPAGARLMGDGDAAAASCPAPAAEGTWADLQQPDTARGPSVVFTVQTPETPAPMSRGKDRKDMPKKSVRMPATLGELNQAATTHLHECTSGPLTDRRVRLFHKGREVNHSSHIAELRDGDEVIIRLDRAKRALQTFGDKLVSTHQAHFVKHPLKPPFTPRVESSTVTDQLSMGKLEGRSCYMKDYVKHPLSARPSTTDGHALYATHFLKQSTALGNDKSTYSAHFPWHNARPIPPAGDDATSAVSEAWRGHRFTARSSYAEDYAKRADPAYPARACGDDSASTLTQDAMRSPFDSKSQYALEYIQYRPEGRATSFRPPPTVSLENEKFGGLSEYQREYIGREAKADIVHLLMDDGAPSAK